MTKVFAVILSGLWITISEFSRNELIFKSRWIDHYDELGLTFETLPINGIAWVAWSLLFAFIIYKLMQKFAFWETFLITWIAGFLMMWLTLFNLQVLPASLLIFAVPMSAVEIIIAQLIIKKFTLGSAEVN